MYRDAVSKWWGVCGYPVGHVVCSMILRCGGCLKISFRTRQLVSPVGLRVYWRLRW
jgi:hypothetical protein